MTRGKDVTSIFCAEEINTRLIRFGEDLQLVDRVNVCAANLGMTRVGGVENVIEAAQQFLGPWKDAMLKHAEHLAGQIIFRNSIAMI